MSTDRAALDAAVVALESQRGLLGDAVVDVAVAPLLAQLAAMAAPERRDAEPRLRQATVLFVDVVGSTALGSALDPEDIHDLMDRIAARFTELVGSHFGRVVKYTGDGLLAVFGVDDAQEHGAEQGIRAGLAMLAAIVGIKVEFAGRMPVEPLNVRVGLDTGTVVVVGGVEAGSNIRGSAVNLAARMEQHAPPGGLRISHHTYRHVRGLFDVVEEPPILVKGVDAPLQTYLVQGARPNAFRVATRGIEGIETRMVGRSNDLAVLQESFRNLCQAPTLRRHLIVAEAGMGKSRLLYEFANWSDVQGSPFHLFTGRAQLGTRSEPYGLLRDAMSRWLRLSEGGHSDSTWSAEGFIVAARPFLPDDGDVSAGLLAQLLGLVSQPTAPPDRSANNSQQFTTRAFRAAAEFIRRMATDPQRGAPVVVLLEDLHWADDGTIEIFDHIARVNHDVAVLVVATARPELLDRHPDLLQPGAATIELGPLSLGEADELVGVLLQKLDPIPPELRQMIATSGDGVPFFMEETVKMLLDDRALVVAADGSWRVVADQLAVTKVPTTLVGVLQARLDSLGPVELAVAQRAAVIGHVFWADGVAALGADKGAVQLLIERGLVVAQPISSLPGHDEFTFQHHLLHQFTYQSLMKSDRRAHHAAAASWLTSATDSRVASYLGVIGEHFERADRRGDAVRCYAEAARQAAHRGASTATAEFVERALPLINPEDLLARWQMIATREAVLSFGDDRDRHDADLVELTVLADALDDDGRRAEAFARRAHALVELGDFPSAVEVGNRALGLAQTAGRTEIAVDAANDVARAHWRMGDLDSSRRLAQLAIDSARMLGPSTSLATALRLLSTIHSEVGSFEAAEGLVLEALEMSRAVGDRIGEGSALNGLGCRANDRGAFDEAFDHFWQVVRIGREVGWVSGESLGMVNLANASLDSGRPSDASVHAQAAADLAAVTGARDLQAAALTTLGYADIDLGRLDQARSAFKRALELFRLNESGHYALAPRVGLATIDLAAGDIGAATQAAEYVVRHLDSGGILNGIDFPFRTYLNAYRALAAAGHPRARDVLESGIRTLFEFADRLPNERDRTGWLNNSPDNQALVTAWRETTSDVTAGHAPILSSDLGPT